MRTENNTTSGPPMRERCALAIGFESSTHDASRSGCREAAHGTGSRVTHATSEFVARRNTSPRCFGFRVALRDTPDRQSEQPRNGRQRQSLRAQPAGHLPEETKHA